MTTNNHPFKGKFIVVDGPDYTGKGTLCRALVPYMMNHPLDREKKFISVVATREPWNTEYSARLRRIFSAEEEVAPQKLADTTTNLFLGDRWEHVKSLVGPSLREGAVVLSDRYMYSTLAYQSALENGLDIEVLMKRHKGMPAPDLTLFLDVPLTERLRRKAQDRNRPFEELFDKDNELQARLDTQYRTAELMLTDDHEKYNHPRHNIVWINGDQSPQAVFEEAKPYIDACLFQPAK